MMTAKQKQPKKGVTQAAGGLVWRNQDGVEQLALVHRPAYDDWTLPRGKLKKKETFQQAALREVDEEAACRARLVSLAGSTCYIAFGWPKVVVFWNMELLERKPFLPDDEIDQLLWLPVDQALERLSYEDERQLVRKNQAFRK
jgi:8-oxo-dGTP diphosphatase